MRDTIYGGILRAAIEKIKIRQGAYEVKCSNGIENPQEYFKTVGRIAGLQEAAGVLGRLQQSYGEEDDGDE